MPNTEPKAPTRHSEVAEGECPQFPTEKQHQVKRRGLAEDGSKGMRARFYLHRDVATRARLAALVVREHPHHSLARRSLVPPFCEWYTS